MSSQKKELIYYVIIDQGKDSKLAYQVNPKLTIGLDPRNDVILVDSKAEAKHLELIEKDNYLILTQLASDRSTLLNNRPLIQNEKYILNASDELKIGSIKLKFKKDLGLKNIEVIKPDHNHESLNEKTLEKRKNIHHGENGLNLSEENDEEKTVHQTILKKNAKSEKAPGHLIKIKTLNFEIRWDFVTKFILGIFFDFYFAYFLLSLFNDIKLHLYLFFGFLEVIMMFGFKTTAGLFILKYRFNRQFSAWLMLFLFLVYPLTKGSFTKYVKEIPMTKSSVIDLHGVDYHSYSTKNSLLYKTTLDSNYFLLESIENQKPILNFFDLNTNEVLSLKFMEVFDTIKFNKFIYRTHPFKLPIKLNFDPLQEKKHLNEIITTDKYDLKEIFLKNGPFLSYINDTKTFFLNNLEEKIETIKFSEDVPVLVFRDQKNANVYLFGNENIHYFRYLRPKNKQLENQFIEKVLAQITLSLIEKTTDKIGFLEMLDSLPEIDFKTLLTLYSQDYVRIKESKNEVLIKMFEKNLNQTELEIIRESKDAGPKLIKQFNSIKNNFD
jgi:pSer/pThr/pTyr-binding forkhead associated (FHA) protein